MRFSLKMAVVAVTAVATLPVGSASASNGVLDPDFGIDGVVTENIGTLYPSWADEVEAQADGKVIVAGTVDSSEGRWSTVIQRFGADGGLDSTFGDGGTVAIDLVPDQYEYLHDMVIDASGNVFVLGGYPGDEVILSLDATGTPRTAFGANGIARHTEVDGDELKALAIAADGSVVVVGRIDVGDGSSPPYFSTAVWRYTAAGALDTTFGTGGITITGFSGSSSAVDVAALSDGSILMLGNALSGTYEWSTIVLKFTSTGVLDTSYDTDGILSLDLGGASLQDESAAFMVLNDGSVLIAVTLENADGGSDIAVAKLTTGGVLDTSFDTDGVASYGPGDGTRDFEAGSLAVLAAGTIIVAGVEGSPVFDPAAPVLIAMSSTGTLVNGFGDDEGNAGAFVAEADLSIYVDVAVSGSGAAERITTVGIHGDLVGIRKRFVARFDTSGEVDTDFGSQGIITDPIGPGLGTSDFVMGAVELSDGRLLSVGFDSDPESGVLGYVPRLSMYLSDGTLDTSWGSQGHVIDPDGVGLVTNLLVDDEGRIVVAGLQLGDPTVLEVKRFLADGSVDTSFGTSGVAARPAAFSQVGAETMPVVVFDRQGRILVGSGLLDGSSADLYLYRLTADGAVDTTFGSNGEVTFSVADFDAVTAIAIDDADRIVLAGYAFSFSDPSASVVARLNDDGSFDDTFGDNGIVVVEAPDADSTLATGVAVDSEGRLVALILDVVDDEEPTARLVRLLPTGELDPSFTSREVPTTLDEFIVPSMQLRSDGTFLVTTMEDGVEIGLPSDSVVYSFDADGDVDTSFGVDGVLRLDGVVIQSLSPASRGDLIVAGFLIVRDIDYDRYLARVLGELSIVPAAPSAPQLTAGDGTVTVTWTTPIDDGAPRPSGYTVTLSPGGATCSTTTELSCEISGLDNGVEYTAVVRAANRIGDGPASAPSTAVAPVAPPTTTTTTVAPMLPSTGRTGSEGLVLVVIALGALAAILGRRQAARYRPGSTSVASPRSSIRATCN